ncbi:MAG: PDZ domain-containing protein, partial [Bdellovibrionales bacterium]|nr:PDZ domain-containing protein [Bdellovibrionales bacterium]
MRDHITLRRRTFVLLLFSAVFSLVLTVNFVHQVAAKEAGRTDIYSQLKVFTDVLALVRKNYVEEAPVRELVEGAIKGMLANLDPHSGYLTPDLYRELQVETKGEFGGLGIEITVKDGILTVVSPIEDSPAFKAGVQAGDKIIKIGDEFTKDLSLMDAVKKMRGPKGTPINIAVQREGESNLRQITVVRDLIHVDSVRYRRLEEGYGYVRLAQFQEGSASEFKKALKSLEAKAKSNKLKG